jgi:hypothetical protein
MTTRTINDTEAALRMALWAIVLVGVTGAMIAGVFSGFRSMLGVATGAMLAVLNLWTIGVVARGYMGKLNPNVPWVLVGMLKFLLLFAAVYGLVRSGWLPIGALFIGYGALPLGIVAAQLTPGGTPTTRNLARTDLETHGSRADRALERQLKREN